MAEGKPDTRFHGAERNVKPGRDRAVRLLLEVCEPQDFALFFAQSGQSVTNDLRAFADDQDLFAAWLGVRNKGRILRVELGSPFLAQYIDPPVSGDRENPCRGSSATTVIEARLFPDGGKRVLKDVIGPVSPIAGKKKPRLEAGREVTEQFRKRGDIPRLGNGDKAGGHVLKPAIQIRTGRLPQGTHLTIPGQMRDVIGSSHILYTFGNPWRFTEIIGTRVNRCKVSDVFLA